ncbi:DUF4373 domain-containing protein [Chitinophaga lutea]|uniref:DUF4373 domain-containing protein n=1 Tax=Chitinophaga lutea TaxID=2488634 RepID=A0A3N4PA50_9BACT|nr:Lin1244/Lin1753 domain-containing protein [Chitinophaga lutea]RPE05522.1 DUF4373 domain-containing protein [Chitinophaga lutea]
MAMKKDAYYFPHFSNARSDRKVKRLIKDLSFEGYGIYFMLLEVLRDQSDFRYPIADLDLLADEFGTSDEVMHKIVHQYELFEIDEEGMFHSPKLIEYLQPYLDKSERARKAADKRWNLSKSNANALPEQSKSNAGQNASKVKKSKVKESKESKVKEDLDASHPLTDTAAADPAITKFREWVGKEAPLVNKMEEPFTEEQILKLQEAYSAKIVAEVLSAMHNKKDLLKKYRSAYLTANNWCKRRREQPNIAGNQLFTDSTQDEINERIAKIHEQAARTRHTPVD